MDVKKEDKSVLAEITKELEVLDSTRHPIAFGFLLMSAVDLLSQMHSGKLKKMGAVKRFKRFCEIYFAMRPFEQELFYQLRNAISHTYGQYAFNEKTHKEFRFLYSQETDSWYKEHSKVIIVINLERLHIKLKKALSLFEADLAKDPELKKRYDLVYRKIGRVTQNETTS